jgi:hypothetical protein
MRSDNLRQAPRWITPDMVGRILTLAMPAGGEEMPVTVVPTRGVKPQLEIVQSTVSPAQEHARRTEEREAAQPGPTPAASPQRPRTSSAPAWTADEDDRLRTAYDKGERIDLVAEELGRTEKAAYSRAAKIGLTHPRDIKGGFVTKPTWSAAEDQLLRELYGEIPTRELPARISRSLRSIYSRAFELDLKHGYVRQWTRTERAALRIAHARGLAVADLAHALGRKAFSVSKYATNHGLSFGRRPLLARPIALETLLALEDLSVPLPASRWLDPSEAEAAKEAARIERRRAADRRRQEREEKRAREKADRAAARQRERAEARFVREASRVATQRPKVTKDCEAEPRAICRPAPRVPSREPAPTSPAARAQPNPDRAKLDRANKRRSDATRRSHLARAAALVDAGEAATRDKGVHVVIAMREVEKQRREEARLACPIESAKRLLQRRYAPVCSMAVHGGDPRLFQVGHRKNLTQEQLLEMAERSVA